MLRQALIALAQRAPLLPGAQDVVFVDLDSTHRQVYGYAKQGAAVGRLKGRKTLHPLIATASTPITRPVMAAIRLRQGKAADVRGAARFLAEALTTVRAIAPRARIIVRADSKFYTADVAATAARYGAHVSLTTGSNPQRARRDHPSPPIPPGPRSTTRMPLWTPKPANRSPTPRSLTSPTRRSPPAHAISTSTAS